MKKYYTKKQIIETIVYWKKVLEEIEKKFPEKLYHATTTDNANKISKSGIICVDDRKWNISRKDVTYWAEKPLGAALYVKMKGAKTEDIIVYEAPLSAFDTSKLRSDQNYAKDINSGSYEYAGSISAKYLRQIPIEEW